MVLQLYERVLCVRLRLQADNWIKQDCILFRSFNIEHPALNRVSSVVATLQVNVSAILEFLIHWLTNKIHALNSLISLMTSEIVQKFPLDYIYRTEGLALTGEFKVHYIFQIQCLTLHPFIFFHFLCVPSSFLLVSVIIRLQSDKRLVHFLFI